MRKLLTFLSICTSFYVNSQICGGSTATINAGNPQSLSSPQYSLNPGGFSPINGNQFVISPNVTTTYTVYTTGTNTNNAVVTSSAIITVTVLPQPVTNPVLFQPSCTSTVTGFNLNLSFTPSSPTPTYAIVWSTIPNGVTTAQQSSVASGVTAGPYTATIVAAGGCASIVSFTLNPTPAPAIFTLTPFGATRTITCSQPTIEITASNAANTYTWSSSSSASVVAQSIVLNGTSVGNHTVIGTNTVSGCTKSYTFQVLQNIAVPSSTVTPNFQSITCSQTAIATVSVYSNPTVNIAHTITDPQGGVFVANSYTAIYNVGGPGTYTHCLTNLENGCSTCKQFTIQAAVGFPTFSLTSPQNFTLGCGSKSVAILNIVGAATTPSAGAPVSYTIIGPPTDTAIPSGSLSSISQYSITVPGTWTVIVKDNTTNCITRSLRSIIQDINPPNLSTVVPLPILDCDHTVTVLQGLSETPNVTYNWAFIGQPGNVPSSSITVTIDPATPSKTLINTYTLTITDQNNNCRNTTTVPMLQNTVPPKIVFSAGSNSISCSTPTIVLTNLSTSQITAFPKVGGVIGYIWRGPTPQEDAQVSTTYLAYVPGTFTLIGKDPNNGCLASGTLAINDYRDYPSIRITNTTVPVPLFCGSSGTLTSTVTPGPGAPANAFTYSWTTPSPPPVVGTNTTPSFVVSKPGTYSLVVTNTLNACFTRTTVTAVSDTLSGDFASDRQTGFAPLNVNFESNVAAGLDKNGITSIWSFGNGTFTTALPTSTAPTSPPLLPIKTTYNAPGTYTVSLNSVKGTCIRTIKKVITVELPSSLSIPNVFTPNGDGINDQYFLKANNLSEVTFVIFDRWGHQVYELISHTGNIIWDGKNQAGVEVAEGSYFFVLTAKGVDGGEYKENGTISLLR